MNATTQKVIGGGIIVAGIVLIAIGFKKLK